ncbi:MAG: hypothetical protein ACXVRK_02820 [Gaiellaceae bacterium]
MQDPEAVLLGEPPGDERAAARARVGLDAEERRREVGRQLGDERFEVSGLEDLVQVPARSTPPRARCATACRPPSRLVLAR